MAGSIIQNAPSEEKKKIDELNENLLDAAQRGDVKQAETCLKGGADINTQQSSDGMTALYCAVFNDHDGMVDTLLESHANVEIKDSDGETPLWRAVANGNQANVRKLLGRNADVNAMNAEGTSVLCRAARNGNLEIIQLLLSKNPNLETADKQGRTALWWTARNGSGQITRALLDKKADPNTKSNSGASALYQAVFRSNDEIVRILLEEKVDVEATDSDGETALWRAISEGNQSCIDLLLKHNAEIQVTNKYGVSTLHEAAGAGNQKVLEMLLKSGANVEETDNQGRTAFWRAVSSGDQGVIDLLVGEGASVNVSDNEKVSTVHEAARVGNAKVLDFLLKHEGDPGAKDNGGRTPLWKALERGKHSCVKILLGHNSDVDVKDEDGVSLLHLAVKARDIIAIRLLLGEPDHAEDGTEPAPATPGEFGETSPPLSIHPIPNINAKDNDGKSPLLEAVMNQSEAIVELLISKGATLGSFDSEGDSELSQAVYCESLVNTRMLLDMGADVEKRNRDGMTALHWASWMGYTSIARLLLERGADIGAITDNGNTALHFAVSDGHIAFIELLLEKSASRGVVKPQAVPHPTETADSKIVPLCGTLDLDARNMEGRTPLLSAASVGEKDTVALLLKSRANISARENENRTALHLAVGAKSLETVKVLLPKMSDIDLVAKTSDGSTALHIAAQKGFKEIVQELLQESLKDNPKVPRDYIAEKNDKRETALTIAADNTKGSTVQYLVHFEGDVTYGDLKKDQVKWARMERANPKQVKTIGSVLRTYDYHWKGSSDTELPVLFWAARNGHQGLIDELLPLSESSPEVAGDFLYWAAVGGQEDVWDLILEKHKEKDEEGRRAITFNKMGQRAVEAAARNGHVEVVQKLLQAMMAESEDLKFKIDTSEASTKTWKPLHWAINYRLKRSTLIVRELLKSGEDPEAPEGDTGGTISAVAVARSMVKEYEDEFDDRIMDLLETPFRLPLKPLSLLPPEKYPGVEDACKEFHANIVDFYRYGDHFNTLERKSLVHETIYGKGPDEIMRKARETWEIGDIQHSFRWIHLPVNNWRWAEDLMRRVSYDSQKSPDEHTRLQNFVKQNRREHVGKTQTRFMYPALAFESKDFHSGEGANISKLQIEAKKAEKEKKEKTPLPIGPVEAPSAAAKKGLDKEDDSLGADAEKQKDPRNTDVNAEKGKGIRGSGSPAEHPKVGQDRKQKEGLQEKDGTTHLEGCKMAICVPFLTMETVEGHRRLRQAIRHAEENQEIRQLQPPSEAKKGLEEFAASDHASPAQTKILKKEIEAGKKILKAHSGDLGSLGDILRKSDGLDLKNSLDKLKTSLAKLKPESAENQNGEDKEEQHVGPETVEWLDKLRDAIDIFESTGNATDNSAKPSPSKYGPLLEHHLQLDGGKGLHTSRTIDQHYYSSLSDTSRRDRDQVVRRYQCQKFKASSAEASNRQKRDKLGRQQYKDGFQIGMVEQLWLWVIDDNTIITCFPQSDRRGNELLDKVRKHIYEETRPQISSVYHLAIIISSISVGFVEQCQARLPEGDESFLHMFASSIGMAAVEEVKYFEAFKKEIRDNGNSGEGKDGKSKPRKLDLKNEITLLEEVKDIRDELNILKSIFEDQKDVLEKLFNLVAGPRLSKEQATDKNPILNYYQQRSDIDLRIEKIQKMQMDTTTTYDSINHLLDLKQKDANIYEAFQARVQAEETTKQGRTILVFTIVTIIFLPMSFLTSLYALNIESFPHIGGGLVFPSGWIFPRIFGTSAAIGIPLVFVAIYVNSILNWYEDVVKKGARDCFPEKKHPKGERNGPPSTPSLSMAELGEATTDGPPQNGDGKGVTSRTW